MAGYSGKLLMFFFLLSLSAVRGQQVYEHISNQAVYEFMEELANEKIIQINSAVKPFSRTFIASCLQNAIKKKDELNPRQFKELMFYSNAFGLEINDSLILNPRFNILKHSEGFGFDLNPFAGFYQDSIFRFQAQVLYGWELYSNSNGMERYNYGGLQAHAYINKNWGLYASLRDNHFTEAFNKKDHLTNLQGGSFKGRDGGVDWSEMRGGISYSWVWGNIGLIKDHFIWGTNQKGATFFSGRQPSFAHISLKLKPAYWLEFNYIHGWLVSNVYDSIRSYPDSGGRYRTLMRNKWISANLFTITPIPGLNVSFGNSIIYSDQDYAAYWIPLFIYKPVDHTLNATNSLGESGQNSQLFLDISIRLIKHLHVYGSLFSDEISFKRMGNPEEHNFFTWKGGFRLTNYPIKNLSVLGEYTFSLPGNYQHPISTTTYQSNLYNLGYYLGDNSDEIYIGLLYLPLRGLRIKADYSMARHGPDVKYNDASASIVREPFMEYVAWKNKAISLSLSYEISSNVYVFAQASHTQISGEEALLRKWTPEFFHGDQLTISTGFNIGF